MLYTKFKTSKCKKVFFKTIYIIGKLQGLQIYCLLTEKST